MYAGAKGERLEPEPALIPTAPEERALMFGYAQEICGDLGLGWCRRLMLIHDVLTRFPGTEMAERLGRRYGYEASTAEAAAKRVAEILGLLADRLEAQQGRGQCYFVGEKLSALDIYWACFAALVEPLPEALCPMPAFLREQYTLRDPELRKAARPSLLEHRDFIYQSTLKLPLEF